MLTKSINYYREVAMLALIGVCLALVANISTTEAAVDITLIGPPGSGKGTVGDEFSRRYGIPRISTGDLVRSEVVAGSEFGLAVKALTENGGLIVDGTPLSHELLSKVKTELSKPKYANGVVFDGYPRTQWQARELEKMLSSLGRKINLAPQLVVPKEVLIERTQGRLVCNKCGISFHTNFKPPKEEMKCDRCCKALTKRADDSLETAKKRIELYEKEVASLLSFYQSQGVLKTIDGTADSQIVFSEIQNAIDPTGLLRRDYLAGTISSYPGPRPDVPRMYNIVEIYENPALFRSISERMAEVVMSADVDFIAAPEARGWGLAGAVAFLTGKPLISIRKPGKLPRDADLAKLEYSTAYSNDAIEMIKKPEYLGKTAVIIDDGNSTGGTALAVKSLLAQAGITGKGILTAIKYHYKKPQSEYLQWLESNGFEASYYDLGL